MRLSIYDDNNDPLSARLICEARIFLDCVELKDCVMADEEAGIVECYAKEWPLLGFQELPTELRSGYVRIVDPASWLDRLWLWVYT